MQDFWTYMLRCSDDSYYVGHTDDIDSRIAQHADGTFEGYTHSRLPVTLVWSERFNDRAATFAAERQIMGWTRAKKEALIRGDWTAVRRLSSRAVLRDAAATSSAAPQDERTAIEPPIIVLVRPQLGENIGKAARAMLNFGLTEMRLVAPRDGWPNPAAGPSASGADKVLEHAQVYETTAEAVADCAHIYATTVRKRGVSKAVVTPEKAAQEIATQGGRSAILFGPERSGLETEDLALARSILTVPINPEFGSLNLAQAVILVAYEWSKHRELEMPTLEEELPPAPQEELEGLIAHFETLLETKGYFFPEGRADATRLTLRNVLTRPGWNHLEIRTLRGVLSYLARSKTR